MATQRFIIQGEDTLFHAGVMVDDLLSAWDKECAAEPDGHPYPQNQDCWGTLHINALVLKNKLTALLDKMSREFTS